jgi:nucleoside-diphosphate-sugar epimerase
MIEANPRRILITGASGFIGGQLFRAFQEHGWETFGVGRRSLASRRYFAIDLSDPIPNSFRSQVENCDVILHAAARSSPWGTKSEFNRANVVATENVLRLAEATNASKLIFLSSSSVYYRPEDQFGIDESTPLALPAVNRYAESKQRAEKIVRGFSRSWCILRPRAVYGVGDSVLFPRILAAAQAGRLPLLVREGEPAVGDLLSIANLVHICLQAAANPTIEGDFNLTDNQPVEIVAFLLEIFQRLGIAAPKRRLSTSTAFRVARFLETLYACCLPKLEPPITRFGVHVFAYSKTFHVNRMLETFGPPLQTVEQSVDAFVAWVQSDCDPYGLFRK